MATTPIASPPKWLVSDGPNAPIDFNHNELRADIREDIAALRSALQEAQQGLVTKVEYRLELAVMEKRVTALEVAAQKQADIAERRRLTAVTSVVAPILVAILVAWLLNRGVVVQ